MATNFITVTAALSRKPIRIAAAHIVMIYEHQFEDGSSNTRLVLTTGLEFDVIENTQTVRNLLSIAGCKVIG